MALLAAGLAAGPAAADVFLRDGQATSGAQFGAAISELRGQADDPTSSYGILVGVPYDDAAGLDAGRVDFWRAGRDLTLAPDLVLEGGLAGERFGQAVARVGDLDGDGWDDFAVGAPGYDGLGVDDGRVFLFRGGPALGTTPWRILYGDDTGYPGGQLGFSLSAAGDLDGDGRDDLIAGAPYADSPGLDQGAAFVYYGPPASGQAPDVVLAGQVAGDLFGWSVTDAGSFLGGTSCVAVGAPRNPEAGYHAGAVYVFGGRPGTFDATYELKLMSSATSRADGGYGWAVRGLGQWGDTSADDLAVGAPYAEQAVATLPGRIEVFFVGTGAGGAADRSVEGQIAGDWFGIALADIGDYTGSSLADLLIGAPRHDAPAADAGRAYVYPGGSGSYASAASLVIIGAEGPNPGTEAGDRFGAAVSAAGDFDGDGHVDLAVGAPWGNRPDNVTAGYVLLKDTSGLVVPAALSGWQCRWSGPEAVAIEFRLELPPAEVTRLTLWRRLRAGGTTAVAVVADGSPAGLAGLEIAGATWRLRDAAVPSAALAADPAAAIDYELRLELAGGDDLRLAGLSGPGAPPPAAAAGPELAPARPNPFNPRTTIVFRAPAGQETACRVLDLRGWPVATLWFGRATGGWQQAAWDGRGDDGRPVPAGVYLVRVQSGGRSRSASVVLAK